MKTPEEIKKGLECCLPRDEEWCGMCPYSNEGCYTARIDDTLAYIQQLEAQRNALIADLNAVCKSVNVCLACSHYRTDWPKPGCELNGLTCKWCWRGV